MVWSWLSRRLLVAALLSGVGPGSVPSFAETTGGENAAMSPVDDAVRTGDFGRAATLLRKLAEAGNSEAQYRLASLYRTGRGVAQDDMLAFKWMKAAAERNHTNAQFNLAKMYLAGRGVTADAAVAKVWLQKAASRGNDDAAKLLAEGPARHQTEPAAPDSTQPLVPEPSRAPQKAGVSSQSGPAKDPRNQRTELLEAAQRGQTDALKKLMLAGASVSDRDDDGNTALSLAASAGRIDAVNALLSARADVNAENRAGDRPLMSAAARGHVDIVKGLLGQGADVAARNHAGDSALTLKTTASIMNSAEATVPVARTADLRASRR